VAIRMSSRLTLSVLPWASLAVARSRCGVDDGIVCPTDFDMRFVF
jgi:hypothetical protein